MSSNRRGGAGRAGPSLVLARRRGKAESKKTTDVCSPVCYSARHNNGLYNVLQVTLYRVLGLTAVTNSSLAIASDGTSSCVAYAAG